jgi:hypothetical protein
MDKDLKVAAWQGSGPPPGLKYHIVIADLAIREARKFLTPDQNQHVAELLKDLAGEDDPTHSVTQSVDAIDDYFELRDKGGILGKINLRVFFYLDKKQSVLLVLGAIHKGNEGQTPKAVRMRIRRRLRKYLSGEWSLPPGL